MTRSTEELLAAKEKNVPRGVFNIHPIFAKEGKGAILTSIEGKEYIDFAGGIGTLNIGYSPKKVVEAIIDQSESYLHTCFHVVMYGSYIELAERLNALTPGSFSKKSMFVNSGAEAVENGVKIARYYTGRPGVICFEQGFHGRTLLALSLTSKVKPYKFGFGPYASEIYRMPAPYCYRCSFGRNYPSCELACARHLEDFFISNADAEHIAALIIEPVTGEGGFIVPPKDYFLQLYEICRKHGILFIMDEVQSGMGRTGKLFASEHFSVEPDIILMAKSLAAGLPLGSITGRTEIMDSPHIGGLGGTFSGNPVACRAALAVLDLIKEENLLERAQKLGEQMSATLTGCMEKFKIIGDVRGLGPMIGIELVKDRRTKKPAVDETKNIIASCREDGLLVISCGMYSNVVRILAPLVISDDQLNRGLAILERAIQKADQNL
jgi:4-aminobutyrate aminotransferase/(S)-3-amino-2-methylpropionate transaminase